MKIRGRGGESLLVAQYDSGVENLHLKHVRPVFVYFLTFICCI